MLQIKNIFKEYKTGNLVQKALDDVSLNLRDNEFVAILGPSGSGKTTLLNIIGGLDRYDKGDLIINEISTKKYKDRDWDSYRNHTIGFVFQSYNLIPHQTILANVELALTISGVSKNERRTRAVKALEEVGLAKQIHKKPNQLSGGQMQRVAIARALVNNPEILLADEPTGALDSETTVQVMELLKEVAKTRLVVMVTHNPELAEKYATRIVNLKDGKILADTNPYELEEVDKIVKHKNMGKTSMSLITSLILSFNNLKTKKGRTILTAFAGSIGIIGIALILSLSNGVNNYIKLIEEETLSEYPLQIQSSGFNISAMLETSSQDTEKKEEEKKEDNVKVTNMLTSMFSGLGSNDLKSFKEYIESDESKIKDYAKAVEYRFNVVPQIYSFNGEKVRKVNPDTSFSGLGIGSSISSNSMMSSMMSTNVFFKMPKDSKLYENQYDVKAGKWPTSYNECILVLTSQGNISDFLLYTLGLRDYNSMMSSMMSTNVFFKMPKDSKLYENQYDVKAGKWPTSYNECILVLTSQGNISDFLLYTLGLRDYSEIQNLVNQFSNGKEIDTPEDFGSYNYDDILGTTFKLINSSECYEYDGEYKVWRDKTDNKEYMKNLVINGEDLKIVGIVQPKEGATSTMLSNGIYYPDSLTNYVIEKAKNSKIVQEQLSNPEVNVFTSKRFDETEKENNGIYYPDSLTNYVIEKAKNSKIVQEQLSNPEVNVFTSKRFDETEKENSFDMKSLIDIDTNAIKSAFKVDKSKINLDFGDLNNLLTQNSLPAININDILSKIQFSMSQEDIKNIIVDKSKINLDFGDLNNLLTQNSLPAININDILSKIQFSMSQEDIKNIILDLVKGYEEYIQNKPDANINEISKQLTEYLQLKEVNELINKKIQEFIKENGSLTITQKQLEELMKEILAGYEKYVNDN